MQHALALHADHYSCPCTARGFIESMRRRMPEKLAGANLGSRYTFGA